VLTIDNPPVNAMSMAVRREPAAAVQAAGRDPAVRRWC
jgi:enoyl-CoA hydratase/carnithine racemase